jgi:hypothetical protein
LCSAIAPQSPRRVAAPCVCTGVRRLPCRHVRNGSELVRALSRGHVLVGVGVRTVLTVPREPGCVTLVCFSAPTCVHALRFDVHRLCAPTTPAPSFTDGASHSLAFTCGHIAHCALLEASLLRACAVSDRGASECSVCDAGYFRPASPPGTTDTAALSCRRCPSHQVSVPGGDCMDCPIGLKASAVGGCMVCTCVARLTTGDRAVRVWVLM